MAIVSYICGEPDCIKCHVISYKCAQVTFLLNDFHSASSQYTAGDTVTISDFSRYYSLQPLSITSDTIRVVTGEVTCPNCDAPFQWLCVELRLSSPNVKNVSATIARVFSFDARDPANYEHTHYIDVSLAEFADDGGTSCIDRSTYRFTCSISSAIERICYNYSNWYSTL